jgi:hypothetical protein
MPGVARQIIGSFEDIGRDVARESVKVPVDIAGKALESLGAASQKQGNTVLTGTGAPGEGGTGEPKPEGPLEHLGKTDDPTVKKAIARAALAQIAGVTPGEQEQTTWDRQQQEDKERKELETRRAAARQFQLPVIRGKQRRGMGGVREKAHTEVSKNARQD